MVLYSTTTTLQERACQYSVGALVGLGVSGSVLVGRSGRVWSVLSSPQLASALAQAHKGKRMAREGPLTDHNGRSPNLLETLIILRDFRQVPSGTFWRILGPWALAGGHGGRGLGGWGGWFSCLGSAFCVCTWCVVRARARFVFAGRGGSLACVLRVCAVCVCGCAWGVWCVLSLLACVASAFLRRRLVDFFQAGALLLSCFLL